MIAVGVRELKERLSHYLRGVKRGEIVMTTHRGPLEAEVRPPGTAPPEGSAVDGALRRLAANARSLGPPLGV